MITTEGPKAFEMVWVIAPELVSPTPAWQATSPEGAHSMLKAAKELIRLRQTSAGPLGDGQTQLIHLVLNCADADIILDEDARASLAEIAEIGPSVCVRVAQTSGGGAR